MTLKAFYVDGTYCEYMATVTVLAHDENDAIAKAKRYWIKEGHSVGSFDFTAKTSEQLGKYKAHMHKAPYWSGGYHYDY